MNSPWRFVRPSVPTFAWLAMPVGGPSFLVVDGAANWRRLLRTDDEGKTWCQIATPVTPEGVFVLEPFMYVAGTYLTAGGPSNVWRSSDRGSTWESLPASLPGVPQALFKLDRDGRRLIAYVPPGPPVILGAPPTVPVLWQSLDGGGSWQPRPTTVPTATFVPADWQAIVPDAANPSRWIAQVGTHQFDPTSIANTRLLESNDEGANWRPVEYPGGATHNDGLLTADLTELVTAMDGGLWRRRPGQAWQSFGKTAPLTDAGLLGAFEDVLYAAGLSEPPRRYQVMRRNDSAGTWSMVGRGDASASLLALSPGRLMSFGPGGMQLTDDDGLKWRGVAHFTIGQLMLAGAPGSRRLYLARTFSVSHSDDGGQTWADNPPTENSFADVAPDPQDRQVLHAAIRQPSTPTGQARSALNRSTDGGATWTPVPVKLDGMDMVNVVGVLAIATTPPALLVTTEMGLLRSADAGATWTRVLSIAPTFMRAAPSDPNTIAAATAGFGVVVSLNGGGAWDTGLGANAIEVQFHPTNPDTLYVLGTSGPGPSWQLSRHSLARRDVVQMLRTFPGSVTTGRGSNRWLAVTPDSRILVRDGQGKLWDSPDDGLTWIQPGDRGSTNIQSILVDPDAPTSVTVTAEGGLLRLP